MHLAQGNPAQPSPIQSRSAQSRRAGLDWIRLAGHQRLTWQLVTTEGLRWERKTFRSESGAALARGRVQERNALRGRYGCVNKSTDPERTCQFRRIGCLALVVYFRTTSASIDVVLFFLWGGVGGDKRGSKRSHAREQEIALREQEITPREDIALTEQDNARPGARDRAQRARDRAPGSKISRSGSKRSRSGSKRSRAREQDIALGEQHIVLREQEIAHQEQEIAPREQEIALREQGIALRDISAHAWRICLEFSSTGVQVPGSKITHTREQEIAHQGARDRAQGARDRAPGRGQAPGRIPARKSAPRAARPPPTRRAARMRGGGGWDRRLVQLSNDGIGTVESLWRNRGAPYRRDATAAALLLPLRRDMKSARLQPAGRNGSGRGPDADRAIGFEEMDAGRRRARPFLPQCSPREATGAAASGILPKDVKSPILTAAAAATGCGRGMHRPTPPRGGPARARPGTFEAWPPPPGRSEEEVTRLHGSRIPVGVCGERGFTGGCPIAVRGGRSCPNIPFGISDTNLFKRRCAGAVRPGRWRRARAGPKEPRGGGGGAGPTGRRGFAGAGQLVPIWRAGHVPAPLWKDRSPIFPKGCCPLRTPAGQHRPNLPRAASSGETVLPGILGGGGSGGGGHTPQAPVWAGARHVRARPCSSNLPLRRRQADAHYRAGARNCLWHIVIQMSRCSGESQCRSEHPKRRGSIQR
eukprot:gene25000-biopygen10480